MQSGIWSVAQSADGPWRVATSVRWYDKLAVFLPGVALAALLTNPLPAQAHK